MAYKQLLMRFHALILFFLCSALTAPAAQTITFSVSNSDNSIFVDQPAVASDGTLTFEARKGNPGTGVVTVTVTAFDNGGTANGGQDAGAALTFTITIA